MAIASGVRDDELIRSGIERWLRNQAGSLGSGGLRDAVVGPLTRPSAGLSSDTCFVSAAAKDGPTSEFVVRLPPAGDGLFPTYDLQQQVDSQNALARAGIPVPAPAVFEPDGSWLGAPFMVMPRVAGRVVTTNPSYVRSGWLADSSPGDQQRVMAEFLTTLASVHRLDATAVDRGVVAAPDATLAASFDAASSYLDWAGAGTPIPGYLLDARAWCGSHLPEPVGTASVLWGDVQLANCVFTDSGSVAALLDFELTGAGPAEMDLGWFFALHDMTAVTAGGDLAGFGDRASMVKTYEAALGRTVVSLEWYEMFGLMRSGSIMVRIARLLAAKGVDDSWLARGNPTEAALVRVRARSEK